AWSNEPADQESGYGHGPLNSDRYPALLIRDCPPYHEGTCREKPHVEREATHPPWQDTAGTEIRFHICLTVTHGESGHQYADRKDGDYPVIKCCHRSPPKHRMANSDAGTAFEGCST